MSSISSATAVPSISSNLIPEEVRGTLRQLTKLTQSRKHREVEKIAREALSRDDLTMESRGALLHKFAGACIALNELRPAQKAVLDALKLPLTDDLRKRFDPLCRRINELVATQDGPIAPKVKGKVKRPPSIASAGRTPPGKKKRSSK